MVLVRTSRLSRAASSYRRIPGVRPRPSVCLVPAGRYPRPTGSSASSYKSQWPRRSRERRALHERWIASYSEQIAASFFTQNPVLTDHLASSQRHDLTVEDTGVLLDDSHRRGVVGIACNPDALDTHRPCPFQREPQKQRTVTLPAGRWPDVITDVTALALKLRRQAVAQPAASEDTTSVDEPEMRVGNPARSHRSPTLWVPSLGDIRRKVFRVGGVAQLTRSRELGGHVNEGFSELLARVDQCGHPSVRSSALARSSEKPSFTWPPSSRLLVSCATPPTRNTLRRISPSEGTQSVGERWLRAGFPTRISGSSTEVVSSDAAGCATA